jgi:ankyrin repeat protein
VDARNDTFSWTALIAAAAGGHTAVARSLLAARARVLSEPDTMGFTALDYAVDYFSADSEIAA